MGTAGSTTCLRCGTARAAGGTPDARRLPCPACGFVVPSDAAAQLDYLDELETWIGVRRSEVAAAALAPPPAPAVAVSGQPVEPGHPSRPVRPARTRPTAAGVLLTVGAFALVAAGLAFTAVAWDLLGPLGQLLVLVVVGAAALAGGWAMARRIPGTANALSVTGVLLLVVAAGFLLSSSSAGPAWARAGIVGALACAGVALGYRQAARQRGAAVVTTSVFAGLAVVALAAAPTLSPPEPWWSGWWAAGVLLLAGAVMLVLDLARARIVTPPVPWAGLGTSALVLGVLVAAASAADRVGPPDSDVPPAFVAGLLMLVGSVALAFVGLRMHRWSPLVGSAGLVAVSGLLLVGALGEPAARSWYAGLALFLAVVLGLLAVLASDGGSATGHRHVLAATAARLATVAGGVAIALTMAAGPPPPLPTCIGYYDEWCVDAGTTAWLRELHPWWSGAVVGLGALLLAAISVLSLRRTTWRAADIPLLASGSLLLGWIALVASDSAMRGADPGVVDPAIGAALVVAGLGTLLVLALARWATWTIWPPAIVADAGVLVAWSGGVLVGDGAAPELLGVLLALPLAVAGYLTHRRLGTPAPSWITVGPALCVVLAPSLLRVVGDTLDRALGGALLQPGAVLREVAVLGIGVLLAAVGARLHLAAVFWTGLVVVVVVVAMAVLEISTEVPQWVWLSVAGALLMLVGARWEWARRQGHRTREWSSTLR